MGMLTGKVAIVTGAAQGIGAACAQALSDEGAKVSLFDIADATGAADAIRAGGGTAMAAVADVSDGAAVAAAVARTVAAFGGVDILINNAALFATLALKPFTAIGAAEWDRVMAVNVRGVFECAKAVAPHMRARRYGKIVNVASATVFKGTPLMAHYVASKGAVMALTRTLARELGDDGIRVNCLAPGLIASDGLRDNAEYTGSLVSANIASRALKREAVPADLTGAMVFLASPGSDFITGQTLVVDGGSVMR